jgi:hypothetical protein
MASWTAHLQRADDRARADCPFCRGRRALPLEAIVGRRTQAMIAAGVLALSCTTPAAALAGETDQDQEGATVPEQVVPVEQPTDPAFDPGGTATDVPFDAPPAPTVQAAPEPPAEPTAIEEEPATNEVTPTADPGDGSEDPQLGEQLTPPPTETTPVPAAPEPVETVPPPAAPDPAEAPTSTPDEAEPAPREEPPALPRKRSPERHVIAPPPAPAVPAPQPAPVDAPAVVSPPAPVRVAHTSSEANDAVQRGDRFHVVERGESLWSIASDLLGDGASTAQIARKVDRLWELNRHRIDTGDPDLVMAGTKLALH